MLILQLEAGFCGNHKTQNFQEINFSTHIRYLFIFITALMDQEMNLDDQFFQEEVIENSATDPLLEQSAGSGIFLLFV